MQDGKFGSVALKNALDWHNYSGKPSLICLMNFIIQGGDSPRCSSILGLPIGCVLIYLLLWNGSVQAQVGWNYLTPPDQPAYRDFGDIQFVGRDTGFVVGNTYSLGYNSSLFRTVDGGATWQELEFKLPLRDRSIFSFKFYNSREGVASGRVTSGIPPVFGPVWIAHTTDAGTTWDEQIDSVGRLNSVGWANETVLIDSNRIFMPGSCYYTNIGSIRPIEGGYYLYSEDRGKTWARYSIDDTIDPIGNNQFLRTLFVGRDSGYVLINDIYGDTYQIGFSSDAGRHWSLWDVQVLDSPNDFQIRAFAHLRDSTWLASTYHSVLISTDNAHTWRIFDQHHAFKDMRFVDSAVGYAFSADSIFKTIDGGKNWSIQFVAPNLQPTRISVLDTLNASITGFQSILHTNDGGWSPLSVSNSYPNSGTSFPYPNPANIELRIGSVASNVDGTVSIVDALGRSQYLRARWSDSSPTLVLDVSRLCDGYYSTRIGGRAFNFVIRH